MFYTGLLSLLATQFIKFPFPSKGLGLEYIKIIRDLQDLCGVYGLPSSRELAIQKPGTPVKPSTLGSLCDGLYRAFRIV